MTKAERLAAKEAADQQKLDDSRKALARTQALRREETRKATDKRRYAVGALADEAGLLAWSNADLRAVFTLLARLADAGQPVAVLEECLREPTLGVGAENGVAESATRVSAPH
jgi:hypothetical protein